MKETLSLALVGLMAVVVVGVMLLVFFSHKKKDEKGEQTDHRVRFSRRAVQFFAVGMVLPTVCLLAVNDLIAKEALGTLLGAFLGYVLSGIGERSE
jgi:Na+/H+ antiporter NhaD/arsenite permease-like protein